MIVMMDDEYYEGPFLFFSFLFFSFLFFSFLFFSLFSFPRHGLSKHASIDLKKKKNLFSFSTSDIIVLCSLSNVCNEGKITVMVIYYTYFVDISLFQCKPPHPVENKLARYLP